MSGGVGRAGGEIRAFVESRAARTPEPRADEGSMARWEEGVGTRNDGESGGLEGGLEGFDGAEAVTEDGEAQAGEELMQLLEHESDPFAYRERLGRYLRRFSGRNAQWRAYFEACERIAARDFLAGAASRSRHPARVGDGERRAGSDPSRTGTVRPRGER